MREPAQKGATRASHGVAREGYPWIDAEQAVPAQEESHHDYRSIRATLSRLQGRARLTDQSVALVIKLLALRAGLDPQRYAGHSLRSGFLTSTARARANIFRMANQSRHKSLDVLREYVRDTERFDNHAGTSLLQSVPRKVT